MSIKIYQKEKGLDPDGIVGKNTIKAIQKEFRVNNLQVSYFLGQISHETANFKYNTENLNYSIKGLRSVFRKYFTLTQAEMYQRKPEKIANRVYANRMGNGNEQSGDGWKYRGRGAIQLTGKNNYKAFSKWVGDETIINNPDIVATKYYIDSAMYYFMVNKLFDNIDNLDYETCKRITKRVNGGYNGLEDRWSKTKKYYNKCV
jgi:putative chitinase